MRFTKMHGLGNAYVYIDLVSQAAPAAIHWPTLARKVSDRHTGIGSDGLILILPPGGGGPPRVEDLGGVRHNAGTESHGADFRMRVFNADGSEAQMCGNGIRCVGKYVYDRGLTRSTRLTIETAGGLRFLHLFPSGGRVESVRVDMGRPGLTRRALGMVSNTNQGPDDFVIHEPLVVNGREWRITGVSMGNPHCVIFVDDVRQAPVEEVGPAIERHPAFPQRINVEFVSVRDEGTLAMRVWERGSGETPACGTGACAAAVAARLNGYVAPDRAVEVQLLGGSLHIQWAEDDRVYMTGPAVTVCDGVMDEQWLADALMPAQEAERR